MTTLPARLPTALARLVAVAAAGRILLLGGLDTADHTTANVSVFDPAALTVTPAGDLAAPAHDAAGGVLGGRVILAGGGNASELNDVQALPPDPTPKSAATIVGHLPQARSDDSVATSAQTLYVVGGYDGTAELPPVLATNDGTSFHAVARLAVTVRYAAAAIRDGTVWVFGGEHRGVAIDDIQAVDLATGTVRIAGHLPHPLAHESVVELGGTLLLIGGTNRGTVENTIYRFDPASLTLTPIGTLPLPTSDMAAATVGAAAYVFGGYVAIAGHGVVKTTAIRELKFST